MESTARESAASTWKRRAVTIPAPFVLIAFSTVLLPLAVLLGVLYDLSRGRRQILARGVLFLEWFLFCECWGVTGTLLIWLYTLRFLGLNRELFLLHNVRLQAHWCAALLYGSAWIFRLKIVVSGEAPPIGDAPMMTFVRHASTVDTLLPVCLGSRHQGRWPRFVFKRELLYDPCLDVVGHRLPNAFVRRGSKNPEEEVERLLSLLVDMRPRDFLIIFPEGTRFTPEKRASSLERLRLRGPSPALEAAESLKHTLSPLRRGPLALLEKNPGADLLIIGHTGLEETGSIAELGRGTLVGKTVHVKLRHIPFAEIPKGADEQARFLADVWREIDDFIDQHQAAADPGKSLTREVDAA